MQMKFRYSRFYMMQPVLAMMLVSLVFLFLYLSKRIDTGLDNIALIIIFCFVIYIDIKGFFLYNKRKKDPIEVTIKDEAISALYRNGANVEIAFRDVAKVKIYKKISHSLETLEIMSTDNSKQIALNNHISKYALFKNTIAELNPTKITES